MTNEQQQIINLMKSLRDEFGHYEFLVTLQSGLKIRSAKFKQIIGKEVIPVVRIKKNEDQEKTKKVKKRS